MSRHKHELPGFLSGRCTVAEYQKWLNRRAVAHCRRDRLRGHTGATREAYKAAIHRAVLRSRGLDAYTGQPLAWEQISRYENAASKAGGSHYKRQLGDLPTVDHVGVGGVPTQFKICAWRTNDAKHDLSYKQFVALCRDVLAHHDRKRTSLT